MSFTRVVNIHREHYDVCIMRPSLFSNPYHAAPDEDRLVVLERFRRYFLDRLHADAGFKSQVDALQGKVLGCCCKPTKACHGDIIAAYLNGDDISLPLVGG